MCRNDGIITQKTYQSPSTSRQEKALEDYIEAFIMLRYYEKGVAFCLIVLSQTAFICKTQKTDATLILSSDFEKKTTAANKKPVLCVMLIDCWRQAQM